MTLSFPRIFVVIPQPTSPSFRACLLLVTVGPGMCKQKATQRLSSLCRTQTLMDQGEEEEGPYYHPFRIQLWPLSLCLSPLSQDRAVACSPLQTQHQVKRLGSRKLHICWIKEYMGAPLRTASKQGMLRRVFTHEKKVVFPSLRLVMSTK